MSYALTTMVLRMATAAVLLVPRPTDAGPVTTRWPLVKFDDRKGVVVLQAPVFIPEMLVKGASFGQRLRSSHQLARQQPQTIGELSGREPDSTYPIDLTAYAEPLVPGSERAHTHDTKSCNILCEYGMQTDVEGVDLCKCRDPCKGILCPDEQVCVPQQVCVGGYCRYDGDCKTRTLCTMGKPRYSAATCSNGTRRYYYDERAGRCRKFRGCDDVASASFSTLKRCTQTCGNSDSRADSAVGQWEAQTTRRTATPALVKRQPATAIVGSVAVHMSRQQAGALFDGDCPDGQPFAECPYNPCERCSIPDVTCTPSKCGRCRAVFVNSKTGFAAVGDGASC